MSPKQTVLNWVAAFNNADVDTLENLYAENAVNHQMPNSPVEGRAAIAAMFRNEFSMAPEMHCIPLQIIEEGEWAVLEWRDPKNFAGCGFFHVKDGLIVMQRGYWDKISFKELYGV
ncbi:MAG: nuclear transport factor 2 family protein [Sphingobacteriales bacterium]|nr:MAG: nuclear transport factor 2 family protein [Sphingobacteriales bacterium]